MEQQAQLERLLQADGFRQVAVEGLRPGSTVAYCETLFGFPVDDQVHTATVHEVKVDHAEGTVHVHHSHGTTEADMGDEVWAKEPPLLDTDSSDYGRPEAGSW